MVPYDLAGLIETMGGKAAAEKRLDEFFVRLDAGYNDPWFASGNEPSFHIPWVYNWLGRPDKTSKVINRILNEQYTSAPDGLPGNDDLGTMGAWYVFACTGLYPMIPGVGASRSAPRSSTRWSSTSSTATSPSPGARRSKSTPQG